jgi:hypothetical protein
VSDISLPTHSPLRLLSELVFYSAAGVAIFRCFLTRGISLRLNLFKSPFVVLLIIFCSHYHLLKLSRKLEPFYLGGLGFPSILPVAEHGVAAVCLYLESLALKTLDLQLGPVQRPIDACFPFVGRNNFESSRIQVQVLGSVMIVEGNHIFKLGGQRMKGVPVNAEHVASLRLQQK